MHQRGVVYRAQQSSALEDTVRRIEIIRAVLTPQAGEGLRGVYYILSFRKE